MSRLREALEKGDWIPSVDAASSDPGSIDSSVLHERAASGAPLLADWYWRTHSSPSTMFLSQDTSREFFHTLVWRLMDAGFDPKTQWVWSEGRTSPSPSPGGNTGVAVDLLDVMLDGGNPEVLRELEKRWGSKWDAEFLSRRIQVMAGDSLPGTPQALPRLHYDVLKGRPAMVKWWLSRGVDVNIRNQTGQTPLFHAPTPSIFNLLLSKGADPTATDNFGRTAFEHWVDISAMGIEKSRSKMVLEALPKARESISTEVLARTIQIEIVRGEYLGPRTRSALAALRPHLAQSFSYGPDPQGKLAPQPSDSKPSSTLLSAAVHKAWSSTTHKSQEILALLATNTPRKGQESEHALARLAMLVFHPREVWRTKRGAASMGMDFPLMLDAARKVFEGDVASSVSRSKTLAALMDVASLALDKNSKRAPSDPLNVRGHLVSPDLSTWLEPGPNGSLLSQVLTCVADVSEMDDSSLLSEALSTSLIHYVSKGLPVPQDTLLPALRILSRFAPGKIEASALGSGSPAKMTLSDLTSRNLSAGLAWWLTAGTPADKDVYSAAGASPDLKERLEAVLGKSPEPWPEWSAMWRERHMSRVLDPSPATAPRPRF